MKQQQQLAHILRYIYNVSSRRRASTQCLMETGNIHTKTPLSLCLYILPYMHSNATAPCQVAVYSTQHIHTSSLLGKTLAKYQKKFRRVAEFQLNIRFSVFLPDIQCTKYINTFRYIWIDMNPYIHIYIYSFIVYVCRLYIFASLIFVYLYTSICVLYVSLVVGGRTSAHTNNLFRVLFVKDDCRLSSHRHAFFS